MTRIRNPIAMLNENEMSSMAHDAGFRSDSLTETFDRAGRMVREFIKGRSINEAEAAIYALVAHLLESKAHGWEEDLERWNRSAKFCQWLEKVPTQMEAFLDSALADAQALSAGHSRVVWVRDKDLSNPHYEACLYAARITALQVSLALSRLKHDLHRHEQQRAFRNWLSRGLPKMHATLAAKFNSDS